MNPRWGEVAFWAERNRLPGESLVDATVRGLIEAMVEDCGSQKRAAAVLGLSQQAISARMERHRVRKLRAQIKGVA